jgi:hypothetical protein
MVKCMEKEKWFGMMVHTIMVNFLKIKDMVKEYQKLEKKKQNGGFGKMIKKNNKYNLIDKYSYIFYFNNIHFPFS